MALDYTTLKVTCGAVATIGLYSVLYKETKLYRFFEHLFLGLAAGYSIVAIWQETLYSVWWQKMTGQAAEGTTQAVPGYWIYMILLPIGLMGYTVFSKKHNWMSRIPIGIILGMWSGQWVLNWWRTYGPQLFSSMQPLWPTTFSSIRKEPTATLINGVVTPVSPEKLAEINAHIYPTMVISNLIFIITLLSAMSYFIFSLEVKNKFLLNFNKLGRWLLMIGFGAIFGSTVMARFALVIDRMSYIWIEWIMRFFTA